MAKKISKAERGLYRKFIVKRTDGQSAKGQKHHGCAYFVLDLTHDPFARAAIASYAEACRAEYPVLSRDLRAWLNADAMKAAAPAAKQ